MNGKHGWGTEARVGIFVLGALLLLGYMSLRVGKFNFFGSPNTFPVKAKFTSISGLTENGPVEIAGVEVGRIKAIHLVDGQAMVELMLRPGLGLHEDAEARVRTKGMLGEKFIDIDPGNLAAPLLSPGGRITKTQAAVEFDQLLAGFRPFWMISVLFWRTLNPSPLPCKRSSALRRVKTTSSK